MATRGKASDKHGRSRKNPVVMHSKTDTSHVQRKKQTDEESEPSQSGDETKWYEEGENEFTTQAIKELDAKVTMQAVGTPTTTKVVQASKKKTKKKRKESPSRGISAKEAQTKYLGKKWNTAPVLCKRGALTGRKGDMAQEMRNPYGLYEGMDESVYSLDEVSEPADRKIKHPCRFYAMQRCKKGAACPFLHSDDANLRYMQQDPAAGVCLDWYYYGSCANGDQCGLAHYYEDYYEEEEEVKQAPICSQWLQGKCRNGQNCKLQHMTSTKEDVSMELSFVSRGAGRIANSVAEKLQKLRDTVLSLRDSLQVKEQHLLTRTLQMVLGRLTQDERETLLGLQKDIVGLTRFRSVLIKRMLKWAFDSLNLDAIESFSMWESALGSFLPKPPRDSSFPKFFEKHLCTHYIEAIRCQMASPFMRCRGEWVEQAIRHSTSPDPLHDVLAMWLPFAGTEGFAYSGDGKGFVSRGVMWGEEEHEGWPVPFRGRVRGLVKGLRKAHSWCLQSATLPSAFVEIVSFLPPVCLEDVPEGERSPGTHPSLDALAAILVDYDLNILNCPEGARDRVGEAVWQLVSSELGPDLAPKITGMLLQMEPDQLLLEAVNTTHFRAALNEALFVLQERTET